MGCGFVRNPFFPQEKTKEILKVKVDMICGLSALIKIRIEKGRRQKNEDSEKLPSPFVMVQGIG